MSQQSKFPHSQSNNEIQADLISPVSIRSDDRGQESEQARRMHLWTGMIAGAVLVAVVVSGVWLWSYFSADPQRSRPADRQPAVAEISPVAEPISESRPPAQMNPTALAKIKAEATLGAFLEIKNILAAKGAERWGQQSFMEITQLSRQGDALLMDQAFETAAQKYESARRKADLLAGRMPDVFQGLVEEGRSALDRGDSIKAQERLKTALLINPEDPKALKSYKRAQTLDDVLKLVLSGKQLEDNNKYALAYADYRNAVSLDPMHQAARQGLERVEKKIKSDRFNELMSEGLAALQANKLKIARDKLQNAKSFQPNAPALLDALQQLKQAELLSRINALRQQALAAEQAEAWDQAHKAYHAVLQLDPTVHFAVQGRQRAQDHMFMLKRLDYYLDHPDALEADEQLQNALALKADIKEMNITGPGFRSKTSQFEELLKTAQTPVKIVIESDDLTQVTIYKVGKLGHFRERHINLRPGTYTVVGSRDGYQDIRQKLVVQSGQPAVHITIRCHNKL